MTESNNPQVQQPLPSRPFWSDILLHRWPTALGIALAALTVFDMELNAEAISSLSAIVAVMALVYLGAAALNQRRWTWLVFLAGFVVIIVLRLLDLSIAPTIILLIIALAFLGLGIARDQGRRPGSLMLQAAGMIAFGAIALAVLYVDLDWARYLLAAALFGHAGWDVVHFRLKRVVAPSYAEFCGVLDLLLGVAILVMA